MFDDAQKSRLIERSRDPDSTLDDELRAHIGKCAYIELLVSVDDVSELDNTQ